MVFTVQHGLLKPIKEADFHVLQDPASCQQTAKKKRLKKGSLKSKEQAGRSTRCRRERCVLSFDPLFLPAAVKRERRLQRIPPSASRRGSVTVNYYHVMGTFLLY